ncbi:PREDICTED: uncharacterized protein LOC108494783 [Lepidothrix coronata]|uniref:Uncharacterized protein LOC108494783 n=1 Tax=Lepidothrix coronata TaxID=321398 RepID=A0A6J0GSQ2_9PASS|nr:PREDICTED: uncharacterized protein LOC108494783 [Lepidothrix coronata]
MHRFLPLAPIFIIPLGCSRAVWGNEAMEPPQKGTETSRVFRRVWFYVLNYTLSLFKAIMFRYWELTPLARPVPAVAAADAAEQPQPRNVSHVVTWRLPAINGSGTRRAGAQPDTCISYLLRGLNLKTRQFQSKLLPLSFSWLKIMVHRPVGECGWRRSFLFSWTGIPISVPMELGSAPGRTGAPTTRPNLSILSCFLGVGCAVQAEDAPPAAVHALPLSRTLPCRHPAARSLQQWQLEFLAHPVWMLLPFLQLEWHHSGFSVGQGLALLKTLCVGSPKQHLGRSLFLAVFNLSREHIVWWSARVPWLCQPEHRGTPGTRGASFAKSSCCQAWGR